MLKIKSPKPHNYGLFIEPTESIPPEWNLGKMDEKNQQIETEIEASVDDKQCIIKLIDYHKLQFDRLMNLNFIFKLYLGIDAEMVKKVLAHKFKNTGTKTIFSIVLYQIIEIGN